MSSEIDKLSRGLMREEIRDWFREASDFPENKIIEIILGRLTALYKKPLTDAQVKVLKRELLEAAKTKLRGVNFKSTREKLIGMDFVTDVTSFYHWRPLDYDVMPYDGQENAHHQKAFELRAADIAIDRKRIVWDDYPANAIIGEHTLYRLLERGATPSQPLLYVKETMPNWYPLAMLILSYHATVGLKKHQGFLPVPGGAFLFRVVLTPFDEDGEYPSLFGRRRIYLSRSKRFVDRVPFTSTFDLPDENGYLSIQLSTYINSERFRLSQEVVYDQLQEFCRKYEKILYYYPYLSNRQVIRKIENFEVARVQQLGQDLNSIVTSKEWSNACSWTLEIV